MRRASSTNHSPSELQTKSSSTGHRLCRNPPRSFVLIRTHTQTRCVLVTGDLLCLVLQKTWKRVRKEVTSARFRRKVLRVLHLDCEGRSACYFLAKMSFRRCILFLSLFAWFAYVTGRVVDCERYPFHSQCRGAQTRKRFVGMEDNKLEEQRYHPNTKFHVKYNIIPDSKLWTILLENGFDADSLLDAYASSVMERRKNNSKRMNARDRLRNRRIPLLQDFLSELDSMDDY